MSGNEEKKFRKTTPSTTIAWGCHRYCTISINLAGHVMCFMPAEILNLAHEGNDCYMVFVFGSWGRMGHCDSDCNF